MSVFSIFPLYLPCVSYRCKTTLKIELNPLCWLAPSPTRGISPPHHPVIVFLRSNYGKSYNRSTDDIVCAGFVCDIRLGRDSPEATSMIIHYLLWLTVYCYSFRSDVFLTLPSIHNLYCLHTCTYCVHRFLVRLAGQSPEDGLASESNFWCVH